MQSMDAKHQHSKRVRFMRFNKMNDGRRRVGESLTWKATVVRFDQRDFNCRPTLSQGAGRTVLRCRSNRLRVLRLYRGCKVTGSASIATLGILEWSGLACYPAMHTTWRSDHSTTATT